MALTIIFFYRFLQVLQIQFWFYVMHLISIPVICIYFICPCLLRCYLLLFSLIILLQLTTYQTVKYIDFFACMSLIPIKKRIRKSINKVKSDLALICTYTVLCSHRKRHRFSRTSQAALRLWTTLTDLLHLNISKLNHL